MKVYTMEKIKKKALRRYNTYIKALKQLKISGRTDLSLGYFKKQNAMDCGNSKCFLCGNPRRTLKLVTFQELKSKDVYDSQDYL